MCLSLFVILLVLNHLNGEGRDGCFTLIDFLMSCDLVVFLGSSSQCSGLVCSV